MSATRVATTIRAICVAIGTTCGVAVRLSVPLRTATVVALLAAPSPVASRAVRCHGLPRDEPVASP